MEGFTVQGQVNESIPSKAKGLLGILGYCAFLVGLDSLLVSPLIPAITSTTHTPAHQGGLLVTAYALLYGLWPVKKSLKPYRNSISSKKGFPIAG